MMLEILLGMCMYFFLCFGIIELCLARAVVSGACLVFLLVFLLARVFCVDFWLLLCRWCLFLLLADVLLMSSLSDLVVGWIFRFRLVCWYLFVFLYGCFSEFFLVRLIVFWMMSGAIVFVWIIGV